MLVIGPPVCRLLLGMALVYPVGAPVTISKKSPLIRILSKGRDCIDFEKNVKTRLCRGGGVLDAPQIGTHLPGNCRAACPQAAAERSRPFPAHPLKNGDAAINLRAGHTWPLQGGAFGEAIKTIYQFCTFPGSW